MITPTRTNYTKWVEDKLWSIIYDDNDDDLDANDILEMINDPDFFKPFCKRLLAFYNSTQNENFSSDNAIKDLQQRAKKYNIPLNRNTITNWFSGTTTPKYGDDDRRKIYSLAFALNLGYDETVRLFNKVYLDRAFNIRNEYEFIYLYCIRNNKTYSYADELIRHLEKVDTIDNLIDKPELTHVLVDVASQHDMSEDDIIQYITEQRYNFISKNTFAKELRMKLLNELTVGADGNDGLAFQECKRREIEHEKKNIKSNDFLLYMIMDADFVKYRNELVSIKDKISVKEISNQFPDKQTLSEKNQSSYILRKDIILLYFYKYWVTAFLTDSDECCYQSFEDELNDILYDCGFSPLYAGNPYDWFFLFCSANAENDISPLDMFREIINAEDD